MSAYNYEYVGYNGAGTFTQTGGTNTIDEYSLYLGYNAGASGTYSLSGNGQLLLLAGALNPNLTTGEYVGYSGSGSFTQSGGTNNLAFSGGLLELGYSPGSSGTYSLSGSGLLETHFETDGYGIGIFTQTGGTNACENLVVSDTGSAYNLSGGGLVSCSNETVETGGAFTQTGGTNSIGQLNIGTIWGNGAYTLSGSGLLIAGEEWGDGAGTFTQTGGTNNVYFLFVSDSIYRLGGPSLLMAHAEIIYPNGTFAHTGGVNSISGSLNNDGVYNLSGSALLLASSENVGYSYTGSFTQSGGTNMAGVLCLGYSSGSSGTYNLNGGLLNVSSLRGGRGGSAAFNWNGGTLQAGSGFSSSLAMTLGTSSSGASFDTAGYTVTLSGPLSAPEA